MSIPSIQNSIPADRAQSRLTHSPPIGVPGQAGEQTHPPTTPDGVDFSSELSREPEENISPSPILNSLPASYEEGTESQHTGTADKSDSSFLAEEKDPNAQVAIFDNFAPKRDGSPTHGELTESVVQEVGGYGEEDTQRYEVGEGFPADDFLSAVEKGDPNALTNVVESMATTLLDDTTGAIEEILQDENSQINTINQSQSVSPASVSEQLLARTFPPTQNPERPMSEEQMAKAEASAADYRSTLAKSLQLEPDVSDDDLARALVTQVSDIFESSDKIKESEERYNGASQQASDNGISHVLSSGNRGTLRDYLDELGVQPDEGFYESSLVTDNTTVVGATDDKGTETLADDTRFEGNAPDAGAEIAAPGTNREMTTLDGRTATRSGTSYAAPEVAAVMANIKALHPELSPQEIEDLLVETAAEVDAPANEVGAGVVRVDEAMAAA